MRARDSNFGRIQTRNSSLIVRPKLRNGTQKMKDISRRDERDSTEGTREMRREKSFVSWEFRESLFRMYIIFHAYESFFQKYHFFFLFRSDPFIDAVKSGESVIFDVKYFPRMRETVVARFAAPSPFNSDVLLIALLID